MILSNIYLILEKGIVDKNKQVFVRVFFQNYVASDYCIRDIYNNRDSIYIEFSKNINKTYTVMDILQSINYICMKKIIDYFKEVHIICDNIDLYISDIVLEGNKIIIKTRKHLYDYLQEEK